jgi:DNA-directed RNA polymerase beta' subunit
MQIDLFNCEEMIKLNKLEEVTEPTLFIKGTIPNPNGLLSTNIFGVSMRERAQTFAYVDLHGIFLHPYIFKTLKRINRNFDACVHGTKNFKIVNGILSEDENGETGIEFIYNNWEKFKWESNDTSGSRELRLNVLRKYKKNELFTKYCPIIPAFYRDVNFENADSGRISHRSEINDKYVKLIRLTTLLNTDGGFDFVMSSTKAKTQDTLVELYDFFKGKLSKKEGMMRRNLMGKSTDYSSRCVISAPQFKYNTPEEMPIDFYHAGVPLSHCCSLFTPFIITWVRNYFRRTFETSSNKIPLYNSSGEATFVEVDSPELYFTDELIKKEIDNFIKNFHDRFKKIAIPIKHPQKFTDMIFTSRNPSRNIKDGNPTDVSNINRPATWCDILYQAAVDVTENKCVYITRYPITDYFSISPMQIHVMSTTETEVVYIGDKVYKHYPKIDLNKSREDISVSFVDTVQMSNTYLLGFGGDYDGDQISIRGVFTQEANEEAIKHMMSKGRIMSTSGSSVRDTHHEPIQTLYSMTKF